MKNAIRLVMIFSAGLSLAGCVSQPTATRKIPETAPAYADRPMNARDHFYFRDLEDKLERTHFQPGR